MINRPKICIPITSTTRDEIIDTARKFAALPAEMVEWRVDFFAGYEKEIPAVTKELKEIIGKKELITTIRTTYEGGESNGDRFPYKETLCKILTEGTTDYMDVEIYRGEDVVSAVVSEAKKNSVKVIGSYHNFDSTPSEEELIKILEEGRVLGVDIGKVACMPAGTEESEREDVMRLLSVTEKMKQRHPEFSLITMSMGKAGEMSRLYGGLYGSAVSFGCAGTASAPGQIELDDMINVFDKIYSGGEQISLIGFMGVGKSTISRKLHELTGRPEVDTDKRIVEEQGCPISQIFEEKGEAYFRQLETDLIDELGTLPPGIISCGGGMALRDINVKKLRAIGNIVLLTATPETIYERVKESTDRPLLNGNMNVPYIRQLMEKRRPFYEKAATIQVATDGKSVTQIAQEIIEKCK
ncbi:MAG: type I 3-dehydroquinate dehydratase [Eubacterium sp.]